MKLNINIITMAMGVGVQLQQDITTASSNNLLFGIIFSPIHLPLDGFNQHNK